MNNESLLDTLTEKYKIPMALTLVGVVLLIGGVVSSGIIPKTFVKSTVSSKESQITISKDLKIDISGSVIRPGVYILNSESRIEDGIKAAGGLSDEADLEYVQKNINLAQRLTDGTKLFIPKVGESGAVIGIQTAVSASSKSEIVNLNSASTEELESLPGVGKVSAEKIIDGRPFTAIEELLTKKAVNKATYEKIKDKVSVY